MAAPAMGLRGSSPPQVFAQAPRFLCKVMLSPVTTSLSAITEGLHLTVLQKTRLAAGLRPDPLEKLTALPRPPSWI